MRQDHGRISKKLTPGELPEDDSPAALRNTLLEMKHTVVKKYNWSLHEIDECDICNLLGFINYKPGKDANTREIDGKTYRRATAAPSWL